MSIEKTKKVHRKDEEIVRQGSGPTNELYYLARGTAVAEVGGMAVGTIQAGEWFGEMAAILGQPRTATVRAVTECEVWQFRGLDDKALMETVGKDPKLILKLLQTLAMRVADTSRRSVAAGEDEMGVRERYRRAISGTAFALEKICEKYKSKVMQEVKDHLTGTSGIASGSLQDLNPDFFPSARALWKDA